MDGNSNRSNMPSKKKKKVKVKGKGRGAACKAKAEGDDVRNDVTSQVQRLKIKNINQDDENEEALLEEAINLAAAEREELEAAEAEGCDHGFVVLPDSLDFLPPQPLELKERHCAEFTDSFMSEFMATKESCIGDRFLMAVEATMSSQFGVWNDPQVMQQKKIYLLAKGVDAILEKRVDDARQSAILASFLEQYRAVVVCKTQPVWDWSKIGEFSNYVCDQYTLVSFFRKRIPCKCLDRRYKEVKKSGAKLGLCCNPSCPLPGWKG